jgi:hypothetical protein
MNQRLFQLPSCGVLYHYTSRASAQEMSMAGKILPGKDGYVYLTDVLYRLGWQATDRLALPEKNAEVVIPIHIDTLPKDRNNFPDVNYMGIVPEFPCGVKRSFRRGGGHQWRVGRGIPLQIFPWSWIELECP